MKLLKTLATIALVVLGTIPASASVYSVTGGNGITVTNPYSNPVVSLAGGTTPNQLYGVTLLPIAAPSPTALSQTAGGTNAATTYYVKETYTNANGETTASTEASLAVSANNYLVVASPPTIANATGWNVYISTATAIETKQNSSPVVIGTSFTLSSPLNTTSAATPSVNSAYGLFQVGSSYVGPNQSYFNGTSIFNGPAQINPAGTSTSSTCYSSQPLYLQDSVWNGTSATTLNSYLLMGCGGNMNFYSAHTVSPGGGFQFWGSYNGANSLYEALNSTGATFYTPISTSGNIVAGTAAGTQIQWGPNAVINAGTGYENLGFLGTNSGSLGLYLNGFSNAPPITIDHSGNLTSLGAATFGSTVVSKCALQVAVGGTSFVGACGDGSFARTSTAGLIWFGGTTATCGACAYLSYNNGTWYLTQSGAGANQEVFTNAYASFIGAVVSGYNFNGNIAAGLAGGSSAVAIGWNASAGNGEVDLVTGYNGGDTARFYRWNGTAYEVADEFYADGALTMKNGAVIGGSSYTYLPTKLNVGSCAGAYTNGDIAACRPSATTTGVLYLGTGTTHYLYFDGSNYSMPGGSLQIPNGWVQTAYGYAISANVSNGKMAYGTASISGTSVTITFSPAMTSSTSYSAHCIAESGGAPVIVSVTHVSANQITCNATSSGTGTVDYQVIGN